MPQDIKSLKRKIDAITSNIKIYQHDRDRYIAKLKKDFNVSNIDEAEALLDEAEDKIKSLLSRQARIIAKADELLKDVKVSNAKIIEGSKRLSQKPNR